MSVFKSTYSFKKNFQMRWGMITRMLDEGLESEIDTHMMLSRHVDSRQEKHFHLLYADKCAFELAKHRGWFREERSKLLNR